MPNAARITDPTNHPGMLAGAGAANVKIAGLPAARIGDQHVCALPAPAGPHPANAVARGSTSVKIGGRWAARMGDTCACGATIVFGAPNVRIGG